ncbi:AAEL013523-PA [Aedes aegypti]|uniref:AAEL013523-PA n=1 Tax=Aedes aegypti TaxID=7159 RepID=Q16IX0_AEDAE|nr:AAEL013523-PA [Aedes aegypti]
MTSWGAFHRQARIRLVRVDTVRKKVAKSQARPGPNSTVNIAVKEKGRTSPVDRYLKPGKRSNQPCRPIFEATAIFLVTKHPLPPSSSPTHHATGSVKKIRYLYRSDSSPACLS